MKTTKRQRIIVAVAGALLVAALPASWSSKQPAAAVQAAKAYSYKMIDQSEKYTGKRTITVKKYAKYVELEGDTAAIKRINKAEETSAAKSMKNLSDIKVVAKEASKADFSENETFYDCVDAKVTWHSKNIISVHTTWNWYAGGVSNVFESGHNYDLTTGKRLKLTDVTKEKSPEKIRAALKKKIIDDDQGYSTSELDEADISKLEFYINKKGGVVVCFGPYELGFGGWSKMYTLTGDVK